MIKYYRHKGTNKLYKIENNIVYYYDGEQWIESLYCGINSDLKITEEIEYKKILMLKALDK
jgi:hypothetical protein